MGKSRENENYLVLKKGKHFTLTSLADHLNEVHGQKKSGEPFAPVDVHKYLDRGHLPAYIGGNALTSIRDNQMGVNLIEIGEPVEISKKKSNTEDNEDRK